MAMELFETHEVTKGTTLQADFCDKKRFMRHKAYFYDK